MGAIRTKLESFKQPKQGKTLGGGKVNVTHYGPKGGKAPKDDTSKAFWMARAMKKDQDAAANGMVSSQLQTLGRGATMDRDAEMVGIIDQQMEEVDTLLRNLGIQ